MPAIDTKDTSQNFYEKIKQQLAQYDKSCSFFRRLWMLLGGSRPDPAVQQIHVAIKNAGPSGNISLYQVFKAFFDNPAKSQRSIDFEKTVISDICQEKDYSVLKEIISKVSVVNSRQM